MTKEISFIHSADLHLDSPFKGLARIPESILKDVRESTFVALERLVTVAIDRRVDFILIVGDLFDNEKQSLKAQIRLRKAFEKLEQYDINVYLSYGNHDYINGNIYPVTYPSNVFEFSSEKVDHFTYQKNGYDLASIYGFSYENRAVFNNKVKEFEVRDESVPYHIAMLHGSISSNEDHDTYAPFLLTDLSKKGFDYWALGHIHQRQILKEDPMVIYSGNTQGRNRKEVGEKGCYHVTLTENNINTSFIPLQALQFNQVKIDVTDCKEVHELETKIKFTIESNIATTSQLIDLVLTSKNDLLEKWEQQFNLNEIIDLINEELMDDLNWIYIFRFHINIQKKINQADYFGDQFTKELIGHFEEASISDYLKPILNHPEGKKYTIKPTKQDEESIKKRARELILTELTKIGGNLD